jgi:hypothetical protein
MIARVLDVRVADRAECREGVVADELGLVVADVVEPGGGPRAPRGGGGGGPRTFHARIALSGQLTEARVCRTSRAAGPPAVDVGHGDSRRAATETAAGAGHDVGGPLGQLNRA